jgi:hypothetical protein
MDLIQALNSINYEKNNIIRNSQAPEVAEKLYPKFPVARSLSYSLDCVLLVNELNTRGLTDHGIDNRMHYEFLLNLIPKKKRFNKWEKPEVSEEISLIMKVYGYSFEKASEVVDLFTKEQVENLKKSLQEGGYEKASRSARKSG